MTQWFWPVVLLMTIMTMTTMTGSLRIKENVIFQKTNEISTSRSIWTVTMVIDLLPYDRILNDILTNVNGVYAALDRHIDFCRNVTVCQSFRRLGELRKAVNLINVTRQEAVDDFYDYSPIIKRSKRSLLPFVGDALSFLFGTTSESDLRDIRSNIKTLAKNQKTMQHVVRKSISILNLTRHEAWENRKRINVLSSELTKLSSEMYSAFGIVKREIDKLAEYVNLLIQGQSLINSLGFVMQNVNLALEDFKMHVNFFAGGYLTPSTVNPSKLQEILLEIMQHIPGTLQMPLNPKTELWEYYKLLRCSTVVWERKIITTVKIPLLDAKKKYEVYKIHSIPIPSGKGNDENEREDMLAQYDIEEKGIAINVDNTQYTLLDENTLERCSQPLVNFCEIKTALQWVSTSTSCAVAVFTNDRIKIPQYCTKMVIPKVKLPKAYYISEGMWIVLTLIPIMFNEICKDKATATSVLSKIDPPVGVINLKRSCYATSDFLILNPYYKAESRFLIKHRAMQSLQSLNLTKVEMWSHFHSNIPTFKLSKLPKELERMKELPMDDLINELEQVNEVETKLPLHLKIPLMAGAITMLSIVAYLIFVSRKIKLIRSLDIKWLKCCKVRPERDPDKMVKVGYRGNLEEISLNEEIQEMARSLMKERKIGNYARAKSTTSTNICESSETDRSTSEPRSIEVDENPVLPRRKEKCDAVPKSSHKSSTPGLGSSLFH